MYLYCLPDKVNELAASSARPTEYKIEMLENTYF